MGLVLRGYHALIEKKILIFGLFVLFLLPASALAADGDSSPESTIVFSETLPDDVMFYPDNETHGTGYAEGFNDIGDWAWYNNDAEDSFGTDGDVAYVDFSGSSGSYDWTGIQTDSPSISGPFYCEFRTKRNTTGASIQVGVFTADARGGSSQYSGWKNPTLGTWTTYKFLVTLSGVESILVYGYSATVQAKIEFDYIRIGPATEMGWQHDGSTTAGVTNDGQTDVVYTATSDGDILTLNATNTGAHIGYVRFYLSFDTTTTAAELEMDYYQFAAVKYRLKNKDASAFHFRSSYDVKYHSYNVPGIFNEWVTARWNHPAGAGSSSDGTLWIDGYLQAAESYEYEIDYAKIYSIANFTVTQSGAGTDDYLYVSSGALISTVDSGYIEPNHDPTLAIVPDTYPLYYNLSTIGTAPEFSMYVSSWSTYSDETRGIISSRIVTDIKLKFDSTEIISEIKFAMDDISIFDELFLSLDMWGYFGPLGLVVIGYLLTKKDTPLGIFVFIVDCLVISHYLTLVDAMPDYWWHIFILLLGVILCIAQMTKR